MNINCSRGLAAAFEPVIERPRESFCGIRKTPPKVVFLIAVWDHDRLMDSRQPAQDLVELDEAVETLAAILVAIDGEQHGWLDLAESIHDAVDAEIRRTGRPDRADRRRAERGDNCFGDVGNDRGDSISGADAQGGQCAGRLS